MAEDNEFGLYKIVYYGPDGDFSDGRLLFIENLFNGERGTRYYGSVFSMKRVAGVGDVPVFDRRVVGVSEDCLRKI